MIQLSEHLGFCPENNHSLHPFFDLKEGRFFNLVPAHKNFIQEPILTTFAQLLDGKETHNSKALLSVLLSYYSIHVEGFGEIQSVEILHTVLNS